MVKPMHEQDPRVKLLTVLNVQSAKPAKGAPAKGKRDWHALARKASAAGEGEGEAGKARKRLGGKLEKAAELLDASSAASAQKKRKLSSAKEESAPAAAGAAEEDEEAAGSSDDENDDTKDAPRDSFTAHFAPTSNPLLPDSLSKEDLEAALADDKEGGQGYWRRERRRVEGFGECGVWVPREGAEVEEVGGEEGLKTYNPKLLDKLKTLAAKEGKAPPLSHLRLLSSYRDVLVPNLELGGAHDALRQAASLHAMNHVLKTRSRILRNNDRLSRSSSGLAPPIPSDQTPQDQSFTRPKVLILAPLRSSALSWMQHLISFLPPTCTLVENYPRFVGEYSLPEGARDKLAEEPENYPRDHVETFRGNIDDSFRVGVKVTRKQARVFSQFYESDILVASPLGLRTSMEKDGDADFLSSIEVLIVDQMDVMTMQNWEHVQFVMNRLNLMPESDHGCDFSRVKPWYLDGKAAHLRQSLLLTRHETPEIRSLFSSSLLNRAGKLKPLVKHDGVLDLVPRGVRQVWTRFECADVYEEEDKRFEWFTTKTLPTLLRSAVASSQTLLVIPSYFDFLRVKRYLSTADLPGDFSFAAISEYTDTPDVSRARGAFFQGKVKWLVVTERFHFYKRYRLRGAKTFVFYSPPQHEAYYPEILSFPFVPPSSLSSPSAADFAASGLEGDVDESELSAQVVFSKWDVMKLERIVGTKDARRMVKEEEGREGKRFTFL